MFSGMKSISICFFIMITINHTFGQEPVFQWVNHPGSGFGQSAISAEDGNIFSTGAFNGTCDFDGGPDVYNLTASGNYDVYVAKTNAFNDLEFAVQFESDYDASGTNIITDDMHNIYVCGYYYGSVDFDPGPGVFALETGLDNSDVFVCKLNSDGDFIWVKNFSGPETEVPYSIKIDNAGDVLISGFFSNYIDFLSGPDEDIRYSNGSDDCFLVKLNADGDLIWANTFGGTGVDGCYSIDIGLYDHIYCTGLFENEVDFNTGPGEDILISAGSYECFILDIDADGNFTWVKQIKGSSYDYGAGIAVDQENNIYVTGVFDFTNVDFDPGPSEFLLSAHSDYYDAFILKLSHEGEFIWAINLGGSGIDYGSAITVNSGGEIFCTGYFNNTADFNPEMDSLNITSLGYEDIFITKFTNAGELLWAKAISGPALEMPTAIISENENVYIAGYFEGTTDFDPDFGEHFETASVYSDFFLLKLGECAMPEAPTNTTDLSELVVCYGESANLSVDGFGELLWFTEATGGEPVATGNSFTTPPLTATTSFFVEDSTCISSETRTVITVEVEVIDNTILFDDNTITTSFTDGDYQWINCQSGAAIPGAVDQSYTPVSSGNYAVITTTPNGCIDTSECVSFVMESLPTTLPGISIVCSLQQNDVLVIDTNLPTFDVNIINNLGQSIYNRSFTQMHINLSVDDFIPGAYILLVSQDNLVKTYQFIIH